MRLGLLVTRAILGAVTAVTTIGLCRAAVRSALRRAREHAVLFAIAAALFAAAALLSLMPASLVTRLFWT
jgi:hypothetical protein